MLIYMNKRIFCIISVVIASITITSQTIGAQRSMNENKIEYIPVKESSRGAWSMIGPDGQLLFHQLYLEEPTVVMNGLFSLGEKDNFTVYKAGATPSVFEGCKDLYSVGAMCQGFMPICKKTQRIQLLSPTGETGTLKPIGGNEIIETGNYFCEGLLPIRNEKLKWGFIDIRGRVIVKPIYDQVSFYSCGRAVAQIKAPKKADYGYVENNEPDRYFILDQEGQIICELPRFIYPHHRPYIGYYYAYSSQFNWLPSFKDGYLLVSNEDNLYSFVDVNGQIKSMPRSVSQSIRTIYDYNDKYIIGHYDIYSMSNFQVINAFTKYLVRYLSPWNPSNIIASSKSIFDQYQLIGGTGSVIKTYPRGGQLSPLPIFYPVSCGDFAFVNKDHNYYKLCNKDGVVLNNTEFIAFGKNIAPNPSVKSDYFPAQTIAEYLNKMITSDGLGRYKIGRPFPGPVANEKMITNNIFDDDELNRETLYYKLEFKGFADNYILDRNGNIIPESKIEVLVMKLTLNDEWNNHYKNYRTVKNYKDIVTSLIKLLKNRGLGIVADSRDFSGWPFYVSYDDDTILLTDGKIYVSITSVYPDYFDKIEVSLFGPKSDY